MLGMGPCTATLSAEMIRIVDPEVASIRGPTRHSVERRMRNERGTRFQITNFNELRNRMTSPRNCRAARPFAARAYRAPEEGALALEVRREPAYEPRPVLLPGAGRPSQECPAVTDQGFCTR